MFNFRCTSVVSCDYASWKMKFDVAKHFYGPLPCLGISRTILKKVTLCHWCVRIYLNTKLDMRGIKRRMRYRREGNRYERDKIKEDRAEERQKRQMKGMGKTD